MIDHDRSHCSVVDCPDSQPPPYLTALVTYRYWYGFEHYDIALLGPAAFACPLFSPFPFNCYVLQAVLPLRVPALTPVVLPFGIRLVLPVVYSLVQITGMVCGDLVPVLVGCLVNVDLTD